MARVTTGKQLATRKKRRTAPARRARSPKAQQKDTAPKKPAGRRAQNRENKQQRIVTVALNLFQTKGFEATTTREIARQAGIAEGTLFIYFKTKEDIALHFFEMEVDHAISVVQKKERLRKAPLEEKLFTLVHTQLEYLAPYERFIGTALVEALKPASKLGVFSHKAQALRHRYVAFVQELIEESFSRKKSIVPVSWWVPDAFWIYYLGVLLFWLHDESPRKENTLAFMDRTLKVGVSIIKRSP